MNEPKTHRQFSLQRTLFLDMLRDSRTRPFFIYVVVILGVGAAVYHWLEGWDWLDSFYFVVITLTTIGYGDLTPATTAGKLVTIFYGINGIVILLTFFDAMRRLRRWDLGEDHDSATEAL